MESGDTRRNSARRGKQREERTKEREKDSRDHVGDADKRVIPKDSAQRDKEQGYGEDTEREMEGYLHPTGRVP